jgi:hypothetical protein
VPAPTGPPSQPSDDVPAQRTQRSRTQPTVPAQGESFDLDNISGDDSDDNPQPARSGGCSQPLRPSAQEEDSGVNGPAIAHPSDSRPAADTHYFFEKVAGEAVCKESK